MMKLKNTIKNSLFVKSLKLAKSDLNKTGLMILFDVMFLVSVFALSRLGVFFAQTLVIPQTVMSIIIFIIFSLVYYLLALFAYSFFKYSILDFIKSLFGKSSFSFNRIGKFYLLNIIIAAIFLAVMIVFNYILVSIRQSYAPFVFVALAIPYLLLLYVIINVSHSLFYEGASVKSSIKRSFEITFTRTKSYRETIIAIILFSLIFGLLFLGSGYLIRFFASKNYTLYLSTYAYFKQASVIILDLALYFIILINRISFYKLTRNFHQSSTGGNFHQ